MVQDLDKECVELPAHLGLELAQLHKNEYQSEYVYTELHVSQKYIILRKAND